MAKSLPYSLYMIINTTTIENTRILFVADNKRAVLLGQNYVLEHPGQTVIAPTLAPQGFSKLDKKALQYLYWNTFAEKPSEDYTQLVQDCLTKARLIKPNESELSALNAANIAFEKSAGKDENSSAPKAPRQPKTPGEAVPKKTSTCGLVWDLCDKVLKETGLELNDKQLRAEIMVVCLNEGINKSTAAVQYGKWKASKSSS